MVQKSEKQFRVHPAHIHAIAGALTEVFANGRYADKVVEYTLANNPKAGSKDRAFIAESIYNLVRFWRLYWAVLGKEVSYQKNDLWQLFGVYWLMAGNELPEFSEFKGLNPKTLKENYEHATKNPRLILSVNDELMELMQEQTKEIEAMNRPADVHLRVNRLKISLQALADKLLKEGIQTEKSELSPDGLIVKNRKHFLNNELFKQGMFEVQDSGSQVISQFLNPSPGSRVVDACAGAGGKSLHLATIMQNKGKIISMDVEAVKLEELKRRARRAGITCIEPRAIESMKTIKRLNDSADFLLLDVPCTGSGVLRRNPDAKYRIDRKMLERVTQTQQEILVNYSKMLKSGGTLVYATCSLITDENERQVQAFLENHVKAFSLVEQKTIYPSNHNSDGFYMAKLRKA